MADAPNPDAPHEHLFHPHQRDRAREVAATSGGVAVVVCVICAASIALDPAPAPAGGRTRVGQRVEEVAPATLARTLTAAAAAPGEGGQREEVIGLVQAAWPTFDARFWRVVVGQRVLFGHAGRGRLEALREARLAREQVVVGALWASGDCYVQSVRRV